MYLKKLELIGFKSFPEKTPFLFNDGITCIVGPNGCGKTNLLDALRWVLGEQKTSLLRSSKMEEVIFAGTRNLKPLGMAEVSLQVSNDDGILPSQYNEISIARRLFRSGESEYLLNRVPCRLKDITDLFADTGLGSHAYAIIQQDMVDAILSDRTEERRFLFEEAAGITKYKQRKKAAERKLDATENDLLRLKDILAEVNTRVNSLKRQVNKAQRYKTCSDELKDWDLYDARCRHRKFIERQKELSIQTRSFEDQKISVESQLGKHQADLEKKRVDLTDLDRKLSEISSVVYKLSEEAHQLETEISVKREKSDNLVKSSEQNREEIETLSKRRLTVEDDKRKVTEDIRTLEEKLSLTLSELEEAGKKQSDADGRYLEFRSLADNENEKLLDLEGKLSSGRTDSANIVEQTEELQTENNQLLEKKNQIEEEKSRRRQKIAETQVQIDNDRQETRRREEEISGTEIEIEQTISNIERLRDRTTELTSGYEATLARKNLLSEMIEHYEGYGSGVVAVFDVASRWLDITGTVADHIRPKSGYQAAIEAALGETAQYILCQNQSSAREAIAYLQQEKAGRATFLILEKLSQSVTRPEIDSLAGVVGWADDLIDCESRYQQVPMALLGRTVVCENSADAPAILDILPFGFRVTTMSGECFGAAGTITGGASEEISLIGRKDEIDSLGRKLDELSGQLQHVKDKHSALTLRLAEMRQTLTVRNQQLGEHKDKAAQTNARLKEEQFKINAADEVITSIDQRIEHVSQKYEKLKHRQYTLSLNFDKLDQEKNDIASVVQSKKERLAHLERETNEAADEVNRLQVKRVERESRHEHHLSQVTQYDEIIDDIAANSEQKNKQISEAKHAVTQIAEQLVGDEALLKEKFDSRQKELAVEQEMRHDHDEAISGVGQIEEQIKIFRGQKDKIGEETHRLEISLTEINSRQEQLEERISTEHEVDIRELEIESPNPDLNEQEITTHIETLRDRIRKMGIVNLLALEEYDQQKERQDFLSRQLDDLISAKATLMSTIQKINQTAKVMFLETIEKARENFKQMYQELFTGGEADIILVDPSNPLESPIEVLSRPRGKKPLTITQLSGGERALTAISLLFALYMVKPSPFCFLDEIDAPLDDVNIGRFLKIVEKFSKQTQFIIITHNKITMEAADTLYGVTMEEPGVSKVVAVKFTKGEDEHNETILDLHYTRQNNALRTVNAEVPEKL